MRSFCRVVQPAFVGKQARGDSDSLFAGEEISSFIQIRFEVWRGAVALVSGVIGVDFVEVPAVGRIFLSGGIHRPYAIFDAYGLGHFRHDYGTEGVILFGFGFDVNDDKVVDGCRGLFNFLSARYCGTKAIFFLCAVRMSGERRRNSLYCGEAV